MYSYMQMIVVNLTFIAILTSAYAKITTNGLSRWSRRHSDRTSLSMNSISLASLTGKSSPRIVAKDEAQKLTTDSTTGNIPLNNSLASNNLSCTVQQLIEKYKGRFLCVTATQFPHCEIYLCGTLHVAQTSVDMVREVMRGIRPNYVVVELCEGRLDNLEDSTEGSSSAISPEIMNMTLAAVIRTSFHQRRFSIKALGVGLLTWMQCKAARLTGSKLGGELCVAAKEAYAQGATVILGDRLYKVTIQRIFDELSMFEKAKMLCIVAWEVLTMSIFKLKDYIHKTEQDDQFIKDEIAHFIKHMPAVANIIVTERDDYIAQTISEVAQVGFGQLPPPGSVIYQRRGRILAVVGAAHLEGIVRRLGGSSAKYNMNNMNNKSNGLVDSSNIGHEHNNASNSVSSNLTSNLTSGEWCCVDDARLREISSSSRTNNTATWPGAGMLHVVDLAALYGKKEAA